MKKIVKNTLRIISVITAFSSVGLAAACGSKNELNKSDKETSVLNQNVYNEGFINAYPDLFPDEFYKYIDFSNDKAHISDNLIAKLVKKVISDMAITDGAVSWAYERHGNKTVDVSFKWNGSSGNQSRTYEIKLN